MIWKSRDHSRFWNGKRRYSASLVGAKSDILRVPPCEYQPSLLLHKLRPGELEGLNRTVEVLPKPATWSACTSAVYAGKGPTLKNLSMRQSRDRTHDFREVSSMTRVSAARTCHWGYWLAQLSRLVQVSSNPHPAQVVRLVPQAYVKSPISQSQAKPKMDRAYLSISECGSCHLLAVLGSRPF